MTATWATRKARHGSSGLTEEGRDRVAEACRATNPGQYRTYRKRWRCAKGHLPAWRLLANGSRECRICIRLAQQARRAKQRPPGLVLAGLTLKQRWLQQAWATRRAQIPITRPIVRPSRPTRVRHQGGTIDVGVHDAYYQREHQRLRDARAAAHPDKGGTDRTRAEQIGRFQSAQDRLQAFEARETQWYRAVHLAPPDRRRQSARKNVA